MTMEDARSVEDPVMVESELLVQAAGSLEGRRSGPWRNWGVVRGETVVLFWVANFTLDICLTFAR